MQNLRVLAGARGRPWRVERVETFDGRSRLAFTHLSGEGGAGTRALVAVRPFEPVSRIEAHESLRPMPAREALAVVERAMARRQAAFTLRAAERLRGDIHPWQLAAALAFERGHARVLVADEAGMGKTVSAGLAIAQCLDSAPDRCCLVLAPGHLLGQWRAELDARLAIDARIADAAALLRLQREIPAGVSPWLLPGCVITSIDFVKQPHVRLSLAAIVWDLLVIDEAHLVCGDSERRDAAQLAADRSRAVLLLTATPSDGGGDRFRALVSLGAAKEPLIHLRHVASGRTRVERALRVNASPPAVALHGALQAYTEWIARASMRATPAIALLCSLLAKRALSSAHSLVLTIDRRLALLGTDAPPAQPSLFESDDDPGITGAATGIPVAREREALERLRALASQAEGHDRKMHALLRLIRRTREPIVVFTCFRDTALHIETRLGPLTSVRAVHGELPPATAEAALRSFTHGALRVLVATDVASQGLNLHYRCRWVLHYDLPWRPPSIRQRSGRVDRIGQTRRAHATFLLERTPLATGADERLRAMTALMHAEERASVSRWDVLAVREAGRLRALRAQPSDGAAPSFPPPSIAVVATEFVDGSGATLERAVDAYVASERHARERAVQTAARRSAQLSRRLRARARRRIARERAVRAAALATSPQVLRQDGLFDRRAERQRGADAATRARVEQETGDAVERHAREAGLTAARCRTIALFRPGGAGDAG